MNLPVREATAADARAIVELIRELAQSAGESSPITEQYAQEYLACPGSYVLLAAENDCVVGLLSYSIRPNLFHASNSCLIEELIVRDSHRGRGVGSALMAEVLDRAALTCAEVSVSTLPDNTEAQRFYQSHGLTDKAVFLERHFDQQ